MAEVRSPSSSAKDLENQVRRILRPIDIPRQSPPVRKALMELRQSLIDARIYCHDYELSEIREEQLSNAKRAKHFLELARRDILTASQYDIFNAIDVAQLTAEVDQIKADLR